MGVGDREKRGNGSDQIEGGVSRMKLAAMLQDVSCLSSSTMATAEANVQGVPLRDSNDSSLQVSSKCLVI